MQTAGDSRYHLEVSGTILETRGSIVQQVGAGGNGDMLDGTTSEPRAFKKGEGFVTGYEGADAGGKAADLVEGDYCEVGW